MNYQNITIVDAKLGDSITPALINSYSSLSIPSYKRAISFLTNNLASFPKSVRDSEGGEVEHELDTTLKLKPNKCQTSTVFWRQLHFHQVHEYRGFALIVREGRRVKSLHNLLPCDVTPFRLVPDGADWYEADQWFFVHSLKRPVPNEDIIYLPGLSPDGHGTYSPASLFYDVFDRAYSISRYQTVYMKKGTIIRGAIEVPTGVPEERQQQILTELRAFRNQDSNDRDVILLTDGAKLNNATISPEQSQLVEHDRESTKHIAQITDVPPWFLFENSEGKYINGFQQAWPDVVRGTFRPIVELVEDELTGKLLSTSEIEQGLKIKMNMDALLRGDPDAQSPHIIAEVAAGVRKRNEARELLGLPQDEDPESDKLQTPAGAPKPKPQPDKPEQQQQKAPDTYAALRPLLDDAAQRVQAKTEKAFERVSSKSNEDRITWGNVFSEEQQSYVLSCIAPVAFALHQTSGIQLDTEKLAQQYGQEIKKRAAGHDHKSLTDLLGDHLHE